MSPIINFCLNISYVLLTLVKLALQHLLRYRLSFLTIIISSLFWAPQRKCPDSSGGLISGGGSSINVNTQAVEGCALFSGHSSTVEGCELEIT